MDVHLRTGSTSIGVQPLAQSFCCHAKSFPNFSVMYFGQQVVRKLCAFLIMNIAADKWPSFVDLLKFQDLLKLIPRPVVSIRRIRGFDHREILRELRSNGENRIIVDCSAETVMRLLKQAQQLQLLTSNFQYLLTTLVIWSLVVVPSLLPYTRCLFWFSRTFTRLIWQRLCMTMLKLHSSSWLIPKLIISKCWTRPICCGILL